MQRDNTRTDDHFSRRGRPFARVTSSCPHGECFGVGLRRSPESCQSLPTATTLQFSRCPFQHMTRRSCHAFVQTGALGFSHSQIDPTATDKSKVRLGRSSERGRDRDVKGLDCRPMASAMPWLLTAAGAGRVDQLCALGWLDGDWGDILGDHQSFYY